MKDLCVRLLGTEPNDRFLRRTYGFGEARLEERGSHVVVNARDVEVLTCRPDEAMDD